MCGSLYIFRPVDIILVKGSKNISSFPCRANGWTYHLLFSFSQKPIKTSCTVAFPFRVQRRQFSSEICFISDLNESILAQTAFPLSINVFDYVFLSIYPKYRKLGSRKFGENKADVFKKGKGVNTYKTYTPAANFFNNLKKLTFGLLKLSCEQSSVFDKFQVITPTWSKFMELLVHAVIFARQNLLKLLFLDLKRLITMKLYSPWARA